MIGLNKDQQSVHFFEKEDVFYLIGSDAIMAADELFHTTTVIKFIASLEMVPITKALGLDFASAILREKSKNVAFYSYSAGNWILQRKVF